MPKYIADTDVWLSKPKHYVLRGEIVDSDAIDLTHLDKDGKSVINKHFIPLSKAPDDLKDESVKVKKRKGE